jgi:hypothetical protein
LTPPDNASLDLSEPQDAGLDLRDLNFFGLIVPIIAETMLAGLFVFRKPQVCIQILDSFKEHRLHSSCLLVIFSISLYLIFDDICTGFKIKN